jgi:hypothetical protein
MPPPRFRTLLAFLLGGVFLSAVAAAAPARSQRPAAATSRAAAATPNRGTRHPTPSRTTRKPARTTGPAKPAEGAQPAESDSAPPPPDVPDTHGPASGAHEAKVTPAAAPAAAVVKTEEADKGVKTYTFGAEEVEGRLKAPQILYFLRRVRAEFDAEPLGHRSFLLELSDTRRNSALE